MWFWLALVSAILAAGTIILNKHVLKNVSPTVLTWATFTLAAPLLFIPIFIRGIPSVNINFFYAALGSSITYVISKTIVNEVLKNNLVSKMLPLASLTNIFTYILGVIFLSESIRIIPLLGLVLVIFGIYVLNVEQAKEHFLQPFKYLFTTKASALFMLAMLLGSATVIFDKIGSVNLSSSDPTYFILWTHIFMVALMTGYLFKDKNKTFTLELKNNFFVLFLCSLLFIAVSYFVLLAYQTGPVALVITINRLQIFFILMFGYIFLKDKPAKHIWVSVFIMLVGTLMIKLG